MYAFVYDYFDMDQTVSCMNLLFERLWWEQNSLFYVLMNGSIITAMCYASLWDCIWNTASELRLSYCMINEPREFHEPFITVLGDDVLVDI